MSGARLLGRYVVGERLGSGGLGEVYLAHVDGARGFRKRVVVKQVRRDLAARPEVAPLLLAEAEVVQRLAHGNIVQVLDYGVDEATPYLVMEHVDGVSLAELLHDLRQRHAPLDVAAALFIVESVCAALAHAHAARDADDRPLGLVHRDVTPGNILLSRDGVVKLTDFGIASLTAAGTGTPGPGTPGYAAPEQLAGAAIDARADLHALGVVFTELLARCPDPPVALAQIAARAAAPDPAHRFVSAAELAAALETWRAARHILHTPADLPDRVRDLQRRRGRLAGRLGAALEQRGRAPETAALPTRPRTHTRTRWLVLGLGAAASALALWFAVVREAPAEVALDRDAPAEAAVDREARDRDAAAGVTAEREPSAEVVARRETPAEVAVAPAAPARVDRDAPGEVAVNATDSADPTATPPVGEPAPQPRKREPGSGRLRVNLVPWAEASVDGRALGRTPIDVELKAGRHRLVLFNPELGQRRTREIAIARGADTQIVDW